MRLRMLSKEQTQTIYRTALRILGEIGYDRKSPNQA